MIASSFVKTVSPDQKLQGMQIPGARWSNFVASAALDTLWLLAAFSVAKNHFASQMQYFSTLCFFSVANAAFSGSFRVAYAALEACYQKVARSCKKTCNRNVLRAFKQVWKIFSLREEDVMIECARVIRSQFLDRNVVSRCSAVRIVKQSGVVARRPFWS